MAGERGFRRRCRRRVVFRTDGADASTPRARSLCSFDDAIQCGTSRCAAQTPGEEQVLALSISMRNKVMGVLSGLLHIKTNLLNSLLLQ